MNRKEAIVTAFIAIWPDSTISVLSYPSGWRDEEYEAFLFDDLDEEADPLDATVYKLPSGFHIQTETWVGRNRETGKKKPLLSVTSFHSQGRRPRKLDWSPDVSFRRWNRIRSQERKKLSAHDVDTLVAKFCSDDSAYPAVPPAAFTIDDVRSMEPFAGIYIAVCETTGAVRYVGKSCNVTKRVSRSRPELNDCKLAVIRMPESEIHFAELHYISKCRPTRNKVGAGLERM